MNPFVLLSLILNQIGNQTIEAFMMCSNCLIEWNRFECVSLMADLYHIIFSSSSSFESEDMSSFLQTFLSNPSAKPKLMLYESPISTNFDDSGFLISAPFIHWIPPIRFKKPREGSQSSRIRDDISRIYV